MSACAKGTTRSPSRRRLGRQTVERGPRGEKRQAIPNLSTPTFETLAQCRAALALPSEGPLGAASAKGRRKAVISARSSVRPISTSTGPTAWAILLAVQGAITKEVAVEPLHILTSVALLAIATIEREEAALTLARGDFDRLLCNVANKLLDARQLDGAALIAAILYGRLSGGEAVLARQDRSDEELRWQAITAFMTSAPLLPADRCSLPAKRPARVSQEVIDRVALGASLQVVWMRLTSFQEEGRNPSPSGLLRQAIFDPDGGLLGAIRWLFEKGKEGKGGSSAGATVLVLLFHHWKQCGRRQMLSPPAAVREFVACEVDLFIEAVAMAQQWPVDSSHTSHASLLSRFVAYTSVRPHMELIRLLHGRPITMLPLSSTDPYNGLLGIPKVGLAGRAPLQFQGVH